MRLNWFLPLKRSAESACPRERGHGTQIPRRGHGTQILRRLGPSWAASPVRRLVQTVCFVLFFWLLLYVCWPYGARPAWVSGGWVPAEVDPATGAASVVREDRPTVTLTVGTVVHVVDSATAGEPYLGPFRIAAVDEKRLLLEPDKKRPEGESSGINDSASRFTPEQIDRLTTSFGPWSLRETSPGSWPSHYAQQLADNELLPAELFLALDPLVSISTAVASRTWIWSLSFAGVLLLGSLVVPRAFCGYFCPLGTLIDLFDWLIGRRVLALRKRAGNSVDFRYGWLSRLKYYLLFATLAAAACGVVVTGFVAAIPLLTRSMVFLLSPLQIGLLRGWEQVPPIDAGQVFSVVLLGIILGLGFVRPRFWCRYVCPTGAIFSLTNALRLTERKVTPDCIGCGKCVTICPFDAIEPTDYTTRAADCTFCQQCGGVCPTGAIVFAGRFDSGVWKTNGRTPQEEPDVGRRRFVGTAAGLIAGTVAGSGAAIASRAMGADDTGAVGHVPVRPPGSIPERLFLEECIRCGQCIQVCPNNVLRPMGVDHGLLALWTPEVQANRAGCEPSCNRCGQVCPTGAIRALSMEEKAVARMGLAVVDPQTCLPHAGREACQLCVDDCAAAGYRAIEFVRVGTEVDELGLPVVGSGYMAPVVLADRCVGCGLCQARCYTINVKLKRLLHQSAIQVEAGAEREDRLVDGSYLDLREAERQRRARQQQKQSPPETGDSYLPDFLKQDN